MGGRSRAFLCIALIAGGCSGSGETTTVTETVTRTLEARPEVARTMPLPARSPATEAPIGLTPLNGFVPGDARPVRVWRVPAGGGVPRQLLVQWDRGPGEAYQREHGLVLWQHIPRSGPTSGEGRWRRVWAGGAPRDMTRTVVKLSDLTGDGHAELLIEHANSGTGNCGPRRVIGTLRGRVRSLFRRWTCDTSFHVVGGRLVRWEARHTVHDAHCCPTFKQRTAYRWDGRRLRATTSALFWNCIERSCLSWPRGPLRFRPRHAAFWDERRGMATGGNRPWLFARTSNGGRTWAIVDAAPCALGEPRLAAGGRASVRFLRCRTEAGVFRVARTRDFGRKWSAR